MVLSPDNLPSHSSHTLLLHTSFSFSANFIYTLIDSSATNNFIDKCLAALIPQYLQHLPTPILLKLFDSDPTSAGDITHYWDSPTYSGPVPFNVSTPSKNSEGTTKAPQTLLQLHLKSAQSFIINIQLDSSPTVLLALINSSTSGTFISNKLDLCYNNLNKPLKLQLFNRSPTSTRITQYHDNALILDNNLRFQVQLLITQLPLSIPIMLGLL
ncbi:hypothetical protein E4T56_gene12433 [Termitomyces sp. T112]|nr:hypothetical protein E4T56_gene12433 [Termitomyces sp. T112]